MLMPELNLATWMMVERTTVAKMITVDHHDRECDQVGKVNQ